MGLINSKVRENLQILKQKEIAERQKHQNDRFKVGGIIRTGKGTIIYSGNAPEEFASRNL